MASFSPEMASSHSMAPHLPAPPFQPVPFHSHSASQSLTSSSAVSVDTLINFGVTPSSLRRDHHGLKGHSEDVTENGTWIQPLPFLDALPAEPLIKILQHMDWMDLLSLRSCCRRLHDLCDEDALWRVHCERHWLLTSKREDQTWKQAFMSYFRDWGRYIECYAVIRQAWNTIQGFLKYRCPQIYESLKEGVPESMLDEAELTSGLHLPLDLRCSFRICNGQRLVMPGLMGSMSISNHYRSESLVDLETASSAICIREHHLQNCLPLTLCIHTATGQYMCLKDGDPHGHQIGQIFYPANDNSYSDSDSEDPLTKEPSALNGHFITADSFTEWLTVYADLLDRNAFPVLMNQIFRFGSDEPQAQVPPTRTLFVSDSPHAKSISVSVQTCFLPELSSISPPHFFHTYRITIKMEAEAPASYASRLETRHWVITDADGREEIVDGPGVIGDHPLLRPGDEYPYVSCVTFSTSHGTMGGYYTFRNLQSQEVFLVTIPVFHLRSLPYVTGEDLMEHKEEVKKKE